MGIKKLKESEDGAKRVALKETMRRVGRAAKVTALSAALALSLSGSVFAQNKIAVPGAQSAAYAQARAAGAEESVINSGNHNGGNNCNSRKLQMNRVEVRQDDRLDNMFTDYGNRGAGWTGGDAAYSVGLPDGRELWMFSDTLLGRVTNGTRPPIPYTQLIHNSFVMGKGDRMTTTLYDNSPYPTAFIGTGDPNTWYWVSQGVVNSNQLQIILPEFQQNGSGLFGFQWIGTSLAKLSLPDLTLKSISNLNSSGGIEWTSWVLNDVGYTYIYGSQNYSMYVARVGGTDLSGKWQYLTTNGWSSNESAAAPVMSDISYSYSVVRMNDRYIMVTMGPGLSNDIYIYSSCSPTGPFTNGTLVYTTPEQQEYGPAYRIITYGAIAHPELSGGDRLVVSYSVNGDSQQAITDASVYRPRFIDIKIKR